MLQAITHCLEREEGRAPGDPAGGARPQVDEANVPSAPSTSRLDPTPCHLPAAGLSQGLLRGCFSALANLKQLFVCLFDLHRYPIVAHWLILHQKNP